jgi:hypothetical protein
MPADPKFFFNFIAQEGFRQQLFHFGPLCSGEHIELTVITSLTYLKLGITKNERFY